MSALTAVPEMATVGDVHAEGSVGSHGGTNDPSLSTAAQSTVGHEDDAEDRASTERGEEKWIWVLDPMTRKLRVPAHLLIPTQATATSGTVPSLCIAYLEGRCRYPWCRQAHVLPAAIPLLRMEAQNAPTCCHLHHDPHDISKLTARFRYIRITNNGPGGEQDLIPAERIASTVGLLRYLVHNAPTKKEGGEHAARGCHGGRSACRVVRDANTVEPCEEDVAEGEILEVPAKLICRLHLAHRCRYLEDCNNIHLCREFESRLQPPPHVLSSLAAVSSSMRTVTIGDTCYSVTPLAIGEVGDDDFNIIAEAQRQSYQQGSRQSTPLWTGAAAAHDAVSSTAAGVERGGPTGATANPAMTNFLVSAGGAAAEAWPATPSLLGYSPTMGSMSMTGAPHLRVYDLCGKAAAHAHRPASGRRASHESDTGTRCSPVTLPPTSGQAAGACACGAKEQHVQNPSSSTEGGASLSSVEEGSFVREDCAQSVR